MKFKIKCSTCGATGWASGNDEPDVNATIVTDDPDEWEGGREDCEHIDEVEIIDSDYDCD